MISQKTQSTIDALKPEWERQYKTHYPVLQKNEHELADRLVILSRLNREHARLAAKLAGPLIFQAPVLYALSFSSYILTQNAFVRNDRAFHEAAEAAQTHHYALFAHARNLAGRITDQAMPEMDRDLSRNHDMLTHRINQRTQWIDAADSATSAYMDLDASCINGIKMCDDKNTEGLQCSTSACLQAFIEHITTDKQAEQAGTIDITGFDKQTYAVNASGLVDTVRQAIRIIHGREDEFPPGKDDYFDAVKMQLVDIRKQDRTLRKQIGVVPDKLRELIAPLRSRQEILEAHMLFRLAAEPDNAFLGQIAHFYLCPRNHGEAALVKHHPPMKFRAGGVSPDP